MLFSRVPMALPDGPKLPLPSACLVTLDPSKVPLFHSQCLHLSYFFVDIFPIVPQPMSASCSAFVSVFLEVSLMAQPYLPSSAAPPTLTSAISCVSYSPSKPGLCLTDLPLESSNIFILCRTPFAVSEYGGTHL